MSCLDEVNVAVLNCFWQETLDEVDKDRDGMISKLEYLGQLLVYNFIK